MLQFPAAEGVDLRVLPEERPALGEWALTVTRLEVRVGLKTTHCFSCFLQLLRSRITSPFPSGVEATHQYM